MDDDDDDEDEEDEKPYPYPSAGAMGRDVKPAEMTPDERAKCAYSCPILVLV